MNNKLNLNKCRVGNKFIPVLIPKCQHCGTENELGIDLGELWPTICLNCFIKRLYFEREIERRRGTNLYALIVDKKVFGKPDQKWNKTKELEFTNSLLNLILTDITGNCQGRMSDWINFYGNDKPLYWDILRERMDTHLSAIVRDALELRVLHIVHLLMTSVCSCDEGKSGGLWKSCTCGNMIDVNVNLSVDDALVELQHITKFKELFPQVETYKPFIKVFNATHDHTCYAVMTYHRKKFQNIESVLVDDGFKREPQDGFFDFETGSWLVFNKGDITVQLSLYYL